MLGNRPLNDSPNVGLECPMPNLIFAAATFAINCAQLPCVFEWVQLLPCHQIAARRRNVAERDENIVVSTHPMIITLPCNPDGRPVGRTEPEMAVFIPGDAHHPLPISPTRRRQRVGRLGKKKPNRGKTLLPLFGPQSCQRLSATGVDSFQTNRSAGNVAAGNKEQERRKC